MHVRIQRCASLEQPGWLALREALWPQGSRDEHRAEMKLFLSDPHRYGQYVAYSSTGEAVGLAEVSLRSDYVNGTCASPVAFLEGLYVVPNARRAGVARALVAVACEWAAERACGEIASDALLANDESHAVHRALGFAETERVVFFRKPLA
jgi:aminoglycoside 6'-N-acetyltransferase I